MTPPQLFMVVAMTPQGVIGRDNALPWHLPVDLAHFRRLTVGHPVIMGRKVYQSIGKALAQRRNIVLSRNPHFVAPGAQVVNTPQAALQAAWGTSQVAIIGGAEVYRLFLPRTQRLELTLVHAEVPGDTFFPDFDCQVWQEVARREHPADEKHVYAMSFITLQRRE